MCMHFVIIFAEHLKLYKYNQLFIHIFYFIYSSSFPQSILLDISKEAHCNNPHRNPNSKYVSSKMLFGFLCLKFRKVYASQNSILVALILRGMPNFIFQVQILSKVYEENHGTCHKLDY